MFLRIIDSALIQFVLDAKPFKPVDQNQDSAEVDKRASNQDYCDNYFGFY